MLPGPVGWLAPSSNLPCPAWGSVSTGDRLWGERDVGHMAKSLFCSMPTNGMFSLPLIDTLVPVLERNF